MLIFKTNALLYVWYWVDKTYLDVQYFAHIKEFAHVLVHAHVITWVSRKGLVILSENSLKQFLILRDYLLQTILTAIR